MYGEEAANNAMLTWARQNPDAAFSRGLITKEQYKDVTGKYPTGYGSSGGGGGGGRRTYTFNTSDFGGGGGGFGFF